MTKYIISHESGDQYTVRNIYCVGRNYAGHARELGNPLLKEPVFFQKALTCLTTEDRIKLPSDRTIQHEIELVILISRPGERITAENAMDYKRIFYFTHKSRTLEAMLEAEIAAAQELGEI